MAFDGFMSLSSLNTPCSPIFRVFMLNPRSMVDFSSVVDVLFVKTDLNWSFSMLAFSLLSLVIEPLCLSGAMPILSCFLALAYRTSKMAFDHSSPGLQLWCCWHTVFPLWEIASCILFYVLCIRSNVWIFWRLYAILLSSSPFSWSSLSSKTSCYSFWRFLMGCFHQWLLLAFAWMFPR